MIVALALLTFAGIGFAAGVLYIGCRPGGLLDQLKRVTDLQHQLARAQIPSRRQVETDRLNAWLRDGAS